MHKLLETSDPAPVYTLRPDGRSDFFLIADHAGRALPQRLQQLGVPDSELERHIAWDIGIRGVTERLSAHLDATAVLQRYSRLVIDCNRDPSWATAIPSISEYTPIPGNEGLTDSDRMERVAAIFTPYHEQIRALLEARRLRRQPTVLIAMHSFTPSFKGQQRAMQLGILYNRDPRLAHRLLSHLRLRENLIVGDNAPYAITDESDYSIPTHGEQRGIPHVEIEIRQDLISTAAGQEAWANNLRWWLSAAWSGWER